jgi:hypothetical protein
MVATAYGLDEAAYHTPGEIPWSDLPERCIIQIHWPYGEGLETQLQEEGFRTLVLCRHPFDLLISVLQFAGHEPLTARWLGGMAGDESSIVGTSPRSEAFHQYCLSDRAAALLAVSREWWCRSSICPVKYEKLVDDPAVEFARIALFLGAELSAEGIQTTVANNSIAALRATSANNHFWKGCPGLWRLVIPTTHLDDLFELYRPNFATFGYDQVRSTHAFAHLDSHEADRNWQLLNRSC